MDTNTWGTVKKSTMDVNSNQNNNLSFAAKNCQGKAQKDWDMLVTCLGSSVVEHVLKTLPWL
jgi:hypothetical protein